MWLWVELDVYSLFKILDSDEACLIAAGVVQSIAVESNRYAGRKERSQQRSSFKDISQAIEVSMNTEEFCKQKDLITFLR